MPKWARILLQIHAGRLSSEGRGEEAALITDALHAVAAGKNVDATMQAYADQWAAEGAPSVESIAEARKAIQTAIG